MRAANLCEHQPADVTELRDGTSLTAAMRHALGLPEIMTLPERYGSLDGSEADLKPGEPGVGRQDMTGGVEMAIRVENR